MYVDKEALFHQKPVLAWDTALPDDGDFRQRVTTLAAPENLDPGYYFIIGSVRENFPTKDNITLSLPVHVTTHAMVVRRHVKDLDGFVTDAVTGAPREGVDVSIWTGRNTQPKLVSESTKTNADGWFSLPRPVVNAKFLAVAGAKDDFACVSCDTSSYANGDFGGIREKMVFFTDRSIYRPGQTVQNLSCRVCHQRRQRTQRTSHRRFPSRQAKQRQIPDKNSILCRRT